MAFVTLFCSNNEFKDTVKVIRFEISNVLLHPNKEVYEDINMVLTQRQSEYSLRTLTKNTLFKMNHELTHIRA